MTDTMADRIKESRENLGMTQAELAEKSKCAISTLSFWETGKNLPRGIKAHALANALGVSLEWLRTGKGPRMAPEPPPYPRGAGIVVEDGEGANIGGTCFTLSQLVSLLKSEIKNLQEIDLAKQEVMCLAQALGCVMQAQEALGGKS